MKTPTHHYMKAAILRAVEAEYEKANKSDLVYQAKKPAILKRIDAQVMKLLRPLFSAVLLSAVLWPSSAVAQGFLFGAGWDQPQTPATSAVAQAIQRGLCEQAAVDFINALGQPAANLPAGSWPINRHQLFWYGKGQGCDGKFEYVSEKDGGGDQGYRDGWEISWEPSSYVPGTVPGLPTGDGTQHPTRWRFVPITPWQGSPPVYTPPPVVTPPVVVPPPPPVVVPPAPLPSTDLTAVMIQFALLNARLDKMAADIQTVRDEARSFSAAVKSKYEAIVTSDIVKYGLAVLAGVAAKWGLSK